MMGFMSVTMILSMFVSNTGACAMICPIVEALVKELYHRVLKIKKYFCNILHDEVFWNDRILKNAKMESKRVSLLNRLESTVNTQGINSLPSLQTILTHLFTFFCTFFSDLISKARRVRVTLLLSIAYSANIGGTGTLIGSTPQLALKGIVEE